MLSRRANDLSVLTCAVALTRFVFRSHYLYDLDSVNFALGMERFDPSVHQPHPPGYFLYIVLGRAFGLIFHDANSALVAISIVASCAAAAMLYVLTQDWFGVRAARFSGALFLVSPLVWFHGTVALTYIVEAFFSALVGFLCWRVYRGSDHLIMPAAIALGLGAGVRPSSLLFLGPLFLFSMWKAPRVKAFAGLAALVAALLVWIVPMLYASGGPAAYLEALATLWRMSPGKQNASASFALVSGARGLTISGIFILCFGSSALLFCRAIISRDKSRPEPILFTWVWLAPALLFFTFVFLRFINSGYLLVIFPPVCAWVAFWASDWYGRSRLPVHWKMAAVASAAAVNVAIFLAAPVYCSYREVREFEAQLVKIQRVLSQVAPSGRTLLVAFDSHFLGFRHAGYYFPGYAIAEYPEVRFPEGIRVFSMRHRDTHLLSSIGTSGFDQLVLFPLPPGGGEVRRFLDEIRGKFHTPPRAVDVEGVEFMIAPIGELPSLFPHSGAPDAVVYTGRDFVSGNVYKR